MRSKRMLYPLLECLVPNSGDLVELEVDQSRPIYGVNSDQDNFFHRTLVPDWMKQYLGLPAITLGGKEVNPRGVSSAHAMVPLCICWQTILGSIKSKDTNLYPCDATGGLHAGRSHPLRDIYR